MTIDSPEIVQTILENKGEYPQDEKSRQYGEQREFYIRIYTYTNDWGKKTYCLFQDATYDDALESPFVHDPILLLKDGELTEAGQQELALMKSRN